MLMMKHRCFIKNTHIRRVAKREKKREKNIDCFIERREKASYWFISFFFFLLHIRSIDWNRIGKRKRKAKKNNHHSTSQHFLSIFFNLSSLFIFFSFAFFTHIQNTSTSIITHKITIIFLFKKKKKSK